ncbi:MAG TPA: ligase-associated DNA damage response endonuclease PdeM [Alphaproteobacteria bacterium]|nr:ligase-associated DNA damage response endonuclease PdeM [Alphaproteobacteria bacterium]
MAPAASPSTSAEPDPRWAPLRLNGAALRAHLSGALWWPERATLVLSDLHLEKGSSYARRGLLLPPYDSRATLERMAALVAELAPERVVCLGDSFHDREAAARLDAEDGAALARMAAGCDWLWVVGNHDPAPPTGWGGRVVEELALGPLVFRHEARAGAVGEVSGHYHPKAALVLRGRRISARCFAHDSRRLVMPAFGAYAGGLDVRDPALSGLFSGPVTLHLLGQARLATFPNLALGRR